MPFSGLLHAKCYPLIERFLSTTGPRPRTVKDLERLSRVSNRTIELYIPPQSSNQALESGLAVRNLFAWIFRQPLVGYNLGHALVELMHTMNQYRAAVASNAEDMMDYLAHQGYLNMACQPKYAVACLRLSETFHMRELYIRAFAHCVGMSDRLHESSEYRVRSVRACIKKLLLTSP